MPGAPHSLAWRLSLLYAVVSAASLAIAGAILFFALERMLRDRDAEELASKLSLVLHYASEAAAADNDDELQHRLEDLAAAYPTLSVLLLDGSGAVVLQGRPETPFPVRLDMAPAPPPGASERRSIGAREFVITAAPIRSRGPAAGSGSAVIALETTPTREILRRYGVAVLAAVGVAIVLSLLLGATAVRIGLGSLRRIAAGASAISPDRLDLRLGSANVPAEVVPLVAAFDNALSRIDLSFRRLSDFSSDLAHELRTPLHSLLLQTQVMLSRERQPAEYRAALEAQLEELDRLSRMTNDMLFIARAENAQQTLRKEQLRVRAELEDVVAYYEPLILERELRVELDGDCTLAADRQLFRRAVGNLLSNAIRHAPAGSTIRLGSRSQDEDGRTVSVANAGPGIPQEHLARVFDRFFRVDSARTASELHAGLGLAIVRSIMRLHGGEAGVTSSRDGPTVFELRFPGATTGDDSDAARSRPPKPN